MATIDHWGIQKAAWQLEDAFQDIRIDVYPDTPKAREAHFQFVWAEVTYKRALLGLVLLSIFETPTWCDTSLDFANEIGGRCTIEGSIHYLSGISYLPPGWGLVIEVFLMLLLLRKFLLEWHVQVKFFDCLVPKQTYANVSEIKFGLAMLVLEAADVIAFAVFRPRFRLAFLARTGYLCLLPAVTELVRCVVACLWEMVSVAVFLAGTMMFFAWIAVTVFKDLDRGTEGFTSLKESMNSMFIAGVSDEFVSVFLKSYTAYRYVGILWLMFLVIAHVLLLSLVLDTLCAAYMSYSEQRTEEVADKRIEGMWKAFTTLVEATGNKEQEVSQEYFFLFLEEISNSPRSVGISPKEAQIMWDAIDRDRSGSIEREEFIGVVGLIQYDFWTTRKDSLVKDYFPKLWNSSMYRKFRAFVDSGEDLELHVITLERVMTLILLVNLVLVVLESYYDLNKWDEPPWMDSLELAFSFIYLGEVAQKLAVYSFAEYWSSISNQFDFFTTMLLLFTAIAERLFASGIATYANMLRLLRLLRVVKNLKNLESVQFMTDTVSKLVMASKDMITLLGVVVFFFCCASVQVFGGDLYENNARLEGSEYLEKHMLVLNFNDVPSAFGVWFVMLLCEYEPNFPEAVSRTSSVPFSWIMFPVFYVCGVSIVFELVKAFTIEVFMSLKQRWNQLKQKNEGMHGSATEDLGLDMDSFTKAFEDRGEVLHYRVQGHPSQMAMVKEAQERMLQGHGHGDTPTHGHGHGHESAHGHAHESPGHGHSHGGGREKQGP